MTMRNLLAGPWPNPYIYIDDQTGQLYRQDPITGMTMIGGAAETTLDIVVQSTVLSSSQLLNLRATPVTVVSPAGPGYYVQPIVAQVEYEPYITNYTLGDVTSLFIGSPLNPSTSNVLQPVPATIMDGSGGPGSIIAIVPASNIVVVPQSWLENTPLVITHNGTGELTNGDGVLQVKVYYTITAT